METRDFNTISPSASTLLLLKGLTDIPFARQAAELMMSNHEYSPDIANNDLLYWARVVHFEHRYKSIDQLLAPLPVTNVLELSSGFSFRGLQAVREGNYHYIDTDLPDMIVSKKPFVQALQNGQQPATGTLELLPLNALDEAQFMNIIDRFPPGEIAIVNEGLLMYLNDSEKQQLCANVRKALQLRGGYWITADIYIKSSDPDKQLNRNDELQRFLEQHRIEDNKFESVEAAASFFAAAGFEVDQKAERERHKLGSLTHLLSIADDAQLEQLRQHRRVQETWRLKVKA
ncbi:hypothetical protein [Chitinophaga vietnamensis]|uniref:hypothetical protein n=1 Tax=Chitinophaga vietnamensis TaxID=2593957 RepID=UPI001177B857|nr:hypothetical protein [Chitinophaga vietnamensis]